MTQEEKQLLLKDLAARVPYGVIVEQTMFPSTLADKEQKLKSVQANNCVQLYWYKYINEFVPIHCIKPYLRPMSSMTEEEKKERNFYCGYKPYYEEEDCGEKYFAESDMSDYIDWLLSRHLDYRGLIPMGLALEAPKDMYKIESL